MSDMQRALKALGLAEGAEEKAIRRAYARLAKQHRPDTDPEGFSRIRTAYETALAGVKDNAYQDLALPAAPATVESDVVQLPGFDSSISSPSLDRIDFGASGLPDSHTGRDVEGDNYEDEHVYVDDIVADEKTGNGFNAIPAPIADADPSAEATELGTPDSNGGYSAGQQHQSASLNAQSEAGASLRDELVELEQKIVAVLASAAPPDENATATLLPLTDSYIVGYSVASLVVRQHGERFLTRQCITQPLAPFAFIERVAQAMDVVDIPTTSRLSRVQMAIHTRYLQAVEIEEFQQRTRVKSGFVARAVQNGGSYLQLLLFYSNETLRNELEQRFAWVLALHPARPDLFDAPTWERWHQVCKLDAINWLHYVLAIVFTAVFAVAPVFIAGSLGIDMAGLDDSNIVIGIWFAVSAGLAIGFTYMATVVARKAASFGQRLAWRTNAAASNFVEVILSVVALAFWSLGDLHTLDARLFYSLLSVLLLLLAGLTGRLRSLAAVPVWLVLISPFFSGIVMQSVAGLRLNQSLFGTLLPLLVLTIVILDKRIIQREDDGYDAARLIVRGTQRQISTWRAYKLMLGSLVVALLLTLTFELNNLIQQQAIWSLLSAFTLLLLYTDLVLLGTPNRGWLARVGYLGIGASWFVVGEQPQRLYSVFAHLLPQLILLGLLLHAMYLEYKKSRTVLEGD